MGNKVEGWKSHLAACCHDSGMSQAAYCRRHGLNVACFGYWRGKLRSATPLLAPSTRGLLPIVLSSVSRSEDRIEVTLPNGIQARLPVGMDAACWVPMIQVLMAC